MASPAIEPELQEVATNAAEHVYNATMPEILCALILPLLALLIGIRINRWLAGRPSNTIRASIVDFITDLLAPLLALAFTAMAKLVFLHHGMQVPVLGFVSNLCAAWLAIHLVLKMSSRNTAGWFIVLVIIPVTMLHLLGLWEVVTATLESIEFNFGKKFSLNLYTVLKTAAAIIALIWLAGFANSAMERRVRKLKMHVSNRMLVMKFFQIFLYFVVFMVGLSILGVDLTALSVLGGAVGVGIGFGLQKIASNFISGIILLLEKSVEIGDQIQLADGTTGFIRQTGARFTLLEIADGREVLIPNEDFITQRVFSYTFSGTRGRIEIPVCVAFGTDLDLAQRLMIDAATNHPRCMKTPEPLCFAMGFADSGINLSLYFWVPDIQEGTFGARSDVIKAIWKSFGEHGITIPYPHQVQIADPAVEGRIAGIEAKLSRLAKDKA